MRTRSVFAAFAAPVLIAGAALAASAGPALAAQSNIKIPPGTQIDVSGGPVGCAPGDLVITVASGHDNMVATPNGFHENATIQGLAQLIDFSGPVPVVLASGHGMAWFTNNETNGAFVDTDNANAQVGGITIHATGTFVVNANGTITVNKQVVTCH